MEAIELNTMDVEAIGCDCDMLVQDEYDTPRSLLKGSNTACSGIFPTAVESLLEELQVYHTRARDEYRRTSCSMEDRQQHQGDLKSALADEVESPILVIVEREPIRLLRQPLPAPPPKLHYSTWWRCISRRLMKRHNKQ